MNDQVLEVEEFGGQHWWRMNLHNKYVMLTRLTVDTKQHPAQQGMTTYCLMDQSIATLQYTSGNELKTRDSRLGMMDGSSTRA